MKKKFLITTMLLSLFCCQIAYAESLAIADTEATEVSAETVEEELDPVSHIYTFTLNGETYTLPCAVTDFTENGWNLGSGTLDSNTYARTTGYYESDASSAYVMFEILNDTDENGIDISELKVVAVNVTQDFTNVEGYEFETAEGICPGMNIEDVKTLYGEPDSENGSYICYHFQDRYEFEDLGGLRDLGDMYAGEDGFYVYKGEEDPNIVERVDLQYFGITSDEKAE